jgi:hypothetical protein
MALKRRLPVVIFSLLSACALQAGTYNFTWTAADLTNMIDTAGGTVCPTSQCNYWFAASRPIWDASTSYNLSGLSTIANWQESVMVAPPPANFGAGEIATWMQLSGGYLHQLPSATPFSYSVTADVAPVSFSFLFNGVDPRDLTKSVQAILPLAPVPEPGSYAALLMLGVAAIGFRSRFRRNTN